MFKCYNCGEQSKAGRPECKVVVETRNKTYNYVKYEGKGSKRKKIEFDTTGVETVEEVSICESCEELRQKAIQRLT